jgi:hypothetical protein
MWTHPPTRKLNRRKPMSDTENRDKAADGGLPSHALFCPLGPLASVEYFGECLVRHNIVDAHALDDPEGYDGYQTLERIGEAYDEITQHLRARAEEALQKVTDLMEDIRSRQNVERTHRQ